MKILFNFASRSRPEKFAEVVQNIRKLSASDNYIILAKLDYNDPFAQRYKSKVQFLKCKQLQIAWGYSNSKVHAINRDMPEDGWDILVNVSDDMFFTHEGFDMVIKSFCEPGIFLHFPDQDADKQDTSPNKTETISTMSIMGNLYYKRFGYVYHPDYISLWCDNEATQVAKMLGAYKKVPMTIFEHRHPAWGKSKNDQQYITTEKFYNQDKETFERRKLAGFP